METASSTATVSANVTLISRMHSLKPASMPKSGILPPPRLKSMELTVPDARRILITRIVNEGALPRD